MTDSELFAATDGAYLALIHLEYDVEQAAAAIAKQANNYEPQFVGQLISDGDSWRERLLGLALASLQGCEHHYEALLQGFHKTGGISIVPIAAVLSVAIRDCGCQYDPQMTESLDCDAWDGEVGFARSWLHHSIGIGTEPQQDRGPNYGQSFSRQLKFYTELSQRE